MMPEAICCKYVVWLFCTLDELYNHEGYYWLVLGMFVSPLCIIWGYFVVVYQKQ